jgi:hypothetical protein
MCVVFFHFYFFPVSFLFTLRSFSHCLCSVVFCSVLFYFAEVWFVVFCFVAMYLSSLYSVVLCCDLLCSAVLWCNFLLLCSGAFVCHGMYCLFSVCHGMFCSCLCLWLCFLLFVFPLLHLNKE